MRGPVAFITVKPSGQAGHGQADGADVSCSTCWSRVVTAYVVSRTLTAGADYLAVFRIAGTVTFIAYGMAYIQESIWFGRRWSSTAKTFLDALIYALLTGGIFGWLA